MRSSHPNPPPAHSLRANVRAETPLPPPLASGPAWRARRSWPARVPLAMGLVVTFFAGRITEAGDLLRGGAVAGARGGTINPGTAADTTARARANAQDTLARTAQALQSVQALQSAARNAANVSNLGKNPTNGLQLPDVPDGLAPGGLQIDPGVPGNPALWKGATLPGQSNVNGQTAVNIRQTAPQAVLNWETFNIGRHTTLAIDQNLGGSQVGQWIAFNKVNDPSGVPSQILGSIQANGQVYVVNRNGIIFGGTSQVDTHALVASSLPINVNLINSGLLNNPDAQFLFSALAIPAGQHGTPAFTPDPLPAGQSYGDVTVQPGAVLTSPTSSAHVGGRIALIGPNVTNNGTISTPDGQTILAAGLQVGFNAHPSGDPSLRGLDTYVGLVTDPSGTLTQPSGAVTNNGLIDAPRANVTMVGMTVTQMGVINSSTSVALNGRIDLLANFNASSNPNFDPTNSGAGAPFFPQSAGTVILGAGSVTQILPEWSSADRVAGTQLPLSSQVNLQGQAVHFASKSILLAPNANVTVSAGVWNSNTFIYSSGQVYLDSGSTINVAGSTDIVAPMTENLLTLQLRGNELADSPLQRTSSIRGVNITIDIRQSGVYNGLYWVGTPLGDATGFVGLIQRTVGELTIGGGTVNLFAGGSVVMQSGSTVDVSGGWISYLGGMVQTTRVVSGANIIDISKATPDRIYQGIYTGVFTISHPSYGITENFTSPLAPVGDRFENGYNYGGNGGSIVIRAPAVALDGTLLGNTVAGPRQLSVPPTTSSLTLNFEVQSTAIGFPFVGPDVPPQVTFQNSSNLGPAAPFALDANGNPLDLALERKAQVNLNPDLLSADGFGSLTISNANGNFLVPSNIALNAPPNGSVTLTGANIEIEGSISAPGGKVILTAYNLDPFSPPAAGTSGAYPLSANRGLVTLGASASLSAAGLVVDNRQSSPTANTLPLVTSGGSIAINALSAELAPGSVIDVSGGATVSPTGKVAYGNAGSISIVVGNDPGVASALGGHLNLGATLKGFSGASGGSLSLQAPLVQIGGPSLNSGILWLPPSFFSQGGFTNFSITGLGEATSQTDVFLPAISIAPDTVLAPEAQSWVAIPHGPMSPGGVGTVLQPMLAPVGVRQPVSLTFNASTISDLNGFVLLRGDIVVGSNSVIRTDPLASVVFNGSTVAILGTISAPGGTITVTGSSKFPSNNASPSTAFATVYLGPQSTLSVAGTTLLLPDPFGRRVGSVLPGGNISITGNIVAQAGSVLDVSGASGTLDLAPAAVGQTTSSSVPLTSGLLSARYSVNTVPTRVDSNAGSITLKGGEELFTDATLLGRAGGPTALGGALSISSGQFVPTGGISTPADITVTVTQSGPTIPNSANLGIGKAVVDNSGNPVVAMGYFAADAFQTGGFDALSLKGNVQFSGPVSITAPRSITVATGSVLAANAPVTLTAPYIAIGTPFTPPTANQGQPSQTPFYIPPTFGAGSLTLNAGLIDVGNISLQNIGLANFNAINGDIRGEGTLAVAGNLYLRAGQIYPITAGLFTIAVSDYQVGAVTMPGSVTIAGSGQRPLPLSAGGQLNIYASNIIQGGVLRAPLGSITVGWDGTGTQLVNPLTGQTPVVAKNVTLTSGSVTSVSAMDPLSGASVLIPYGINSTGTSWIDPTGTDITAGAAPQKVITIAGQNVSDQAGSVINVQGGGDLYAYRFNQGTGGMEDILGWNFVGTWAPGTTYQQTQIVSYNGAFWYARTTSTPNAPPTANLYWKQVTQSFAVIPGYQFNYAPYATFNISTDPGYPTTGLTVGDQVRLGASTGLPAGVYTLLPARYALLPGAFLVTPESGNPVGSSLQLDGSSLVAGTRFNSLNAGRIVPNLTTKFEVAPESVVRSRANYQDFFATTFLRQSAFQLGIVVPRLPNDAGRLIVSGVQSLTLDGDVYGRALTGEPPVGGRGAEIDISTSADILIAGPGVPGAPGEVVLDSNRLNSFGAETLLIGGERTTSTSATAITVNTGNLTVDNAGAPLIGPEIILVAQKDLTLATGAEIQQKGVIAPFPGFQAQQISIGDPTIPGSGDGAFLRLSSNQVPVVRSGVDSSKAPNLNIDAGAHLTGTAITLDSSAGMFVDPDAQVTGGDVAINSNRISVQFNNPGALQTTLDPGLILGGAVLQGLLSSGKLSLTGYSSLDFYGTGQFISGNLALHTPDLRGFNTNGGSLSFTAQNVLLDNAPGLTGPGASPTLLGDLQFNATTIQLGTGQTNLDQYATVELTASSGLLFQGTQRSPGLNVPGALTITAPSVTGASASIESIIAGGALSVLPPALGTGTPATPGLGANLALQGASVTANSNILLPSGQLALHATGAGGDVSVGGRLDVSGTTQRFYDVTKYTDSGSIILISDQHNVSLGAGSIVSVAAPLGGGNAGTISVSAPQGNFTLAGSLAGQGGAGGTNGVFSADFSPGAGVTSLSPLDKALNLAGFFQSRSYRVRTGDVNVDGLATSHTYNVSADAGSITVTGKGVIDASGPQGGTVNLVANGSLILNSGALITVAAQNFSDAGKGGSVTLEAGSETNGNFPSNALGVGPQLDIQSGAKIDLSVASVDSIANPVQRAAAISAAQALGKFTGTLHLRAPQTATGTDLQISEIAGEIDNPSSVVIEGYQLYNLQQGGLITNSGSTQNLGGNITDINVDVQDSVSQNGNLFASTASTAAMSTRLGIGTGTSLPDSTVVSIVPGAEIINLSGNLTLGSIGADGTSDWNLGSPAFRFGNNQVPGVLTMRAADKLVFYNSLTDGFNITDPTNANAAQLLAFNPLLPANAQTWSYNLASGADLTAADFHQIQTTTALSNSGSTGSLQLGQDGGRTTASSVGKNATTASAIGTLYQVIRTGSGNIDIAAGGSVQLLNQFATIYTAGTQLADSTLGGTFDIPAPAVLGNDGNLGNTQEATAYPALFSLGGGNVTIHAQADIIHQTVIGGVLVNDSEKQLPINWLDRRGFVDPTTGLFGPGPAENSASTSWWTDFSNFFEGVGALGGGNVTMIAGHNITNVDAVVPTNARMPGYTDATKTMNAAPNASALVELGGGDLVIKAGNNIDGGVYYVERGNGTLQAGGQITTNSTRSPSLGLLTVKNTILPSQTWLPTTLFLGKGSFNVSALGNVLLGPMVNPFLMPQGFNNGFDYKTYFSTYAASDSIDVSSVGGDVSFRLAVTLPSTAAVSNAQPTLETWMASVSLLTLNPLSVSAYQPWLKLSEDRVTPFATLMSLAPPTLEATAFAGNINLNGNLTLAPSPTGTLELLARGGVNGLQPDGAGTIRQIAETIWNPTMINLSDASPSSVPGIAAPYAYLNYLANNPQVSPFATASNFLNGVNSFFTESGSTLGTFSVFAVQEVLHGTTLLHKNDPNPVQIYSGAGSIADLTLFSGKAARLLAGGDITDVGLYLQNDSPSDVSVVSAGRDLFAYNANSPLRAAATSAGNVLSGTVLRPSGNIFPPPATGDIQISGQGTLEVLAGRNIDFGNGANLQNGTGVGITSIGNSRNPNLPFAGADVVLGAGLGAVGELSSNPGVDFDTFVTKYITASSSYLSELGVTANDLQALTKEQKDALALQIFFLILRDAGRNHNLAGSPSFGSYAPGTAAINQLFQGATGTGNITTQSRNIRTKNGGAISIVAPNGELALGATTIGNPETPPGIVTEDGGNINIFTNNDVNIGISRIFTLRGGNIIIWSSTGNIAAGSASKTVQTAPPTRVLVDAQSANVQTDLAGLATGGGIGVLATVADVPPGNVDLIAPKGVVDAGDAGIRATGNLNIAATKVLNADNIQVSGTSTGTPVAVVPAAPNIGALSQASAAQSAASDQSGQLQKQQHETTTQEAPDSAITVEVLGYGGGEGASTNSGASQ